MTKFKRATRNMERLNVINMRVGYIFSRKMNARQRRRLKHWDSVAVKAYIKEYGL